MKHISIYEERLKYPSTSKVPSQQVKTHKETKAANQTQQMRVSGIIKIKAEINEPQKNTT